jgi:hypothetical protein
MTGKQKFALAIVIMCAYAIGWNFGRESGMLEGENKIKAEAAPYLQKCANYLDMCSEMLKQKPSIEPPPTFSKDPGTSI